MPLLAALFLGPAAAAAEESRGLSVEVRASEARDALVAGTLDLYGSSYALVIGIDTYTGGWPRLSNAVRDAGLVAESLRAQGFAVTLLTDLDGASLEKTLKEFFVVKGNEADSRLLLWFAGHGHTEGGESFLIPADAPLPDAGPSFMLTSLPLRRLGEYVRLAKARHVLAVFDSCFSGTIFDSQRTTPPVAITRATALPVRQFMTSGDAGQTVSDDGMFRELFLRALDGSERADANVDGYVTATELGLFLTDRVTNLTEGRQTPRYGKLRDRDYDQGDFVFTALGVPERRQMAQPPLVVPTPTDPAAFELAFWQSIQNSADPRDFEAYLKRYPEGHFSDLARNRLADLEPAEQSPAPPEPQTALSQTQFVLWESIRDSDAPGDFEAYLERYPEGTFADLAHSRIQALRAAQEQNAIDLEPAKPSGAPPETGSAPPEAQAALPETQIAALHPALKFVGTWEGEADLKCSGIRITSLKTLTVSLAISENMAKATVFYRVIRGNVSEKKETVVNISSEGDWSVEFQISSSVERSSLFIRGNLKSRLTTIKFGNPYATCSGDIHMVKNSD